MKKSINNLPRFIWCVFVLVGGICLVVCLLQVTQGALYAAPVANFVVTKTDDTNDGVCNADCSLREAIIATNNTPGADTITLASGTYLLTISGADEDASLTGDLDILDEVTLLGDDPQTTIIDTALMTPADRVLNIHAAGSLTLQNVTVRGGDAGSTRGGGIRIIGGSAILTNTVITGNKARDGGGIYIRGGSLQISDSHLDGNYVTGEGGALRIDSYLNNTSATVTINNSTLNGNTADGSAQTSRGAGISSASSSSRASLTLTGSEVNDNIITSTNGAGEGAGISFYDHWDGATPSQLTLVDSSVNGNQNATMPDSIELLGGGIRFRGLSLTISNTQIIGNAAGRGGGMFVEKTIGDGVANMHMTNCVVNGNQATTKDGGGIEAGYLSIRDTQIMSSSHHPITRQWRCDADPRAARK